MNPIQSATLRQPAPPVAADGAPRAMPDSPAPSALTPGGIWAAEVVAAEATALVLAMGRELVRVTPEAALPLGARLLVRVVEGGDTPILEILDPHRAALAAVAAVLAALEQADGDPQGPVANGAPPEDTPGNRAQPAILDLIRAAADTPAAARAWLLDAAASLVVRVEFQPGRASVVAIDVEDEAPGPGEDGRRSVRLFADLPSLGPVAVTVQLQGNSIGTNFTVGDQAAAQLVRTHQGALEEALSRAGWTRASVSVTADAAQLSLRRARTATSAGGRANGPGRVVSLRA